VFVVANVFFFCCVWQVLRLRLNAVVWRALSLSWMISSLSSMISSGVRVCVFVCGVCVCLCACVFMRTAGSPDTHIGGGWGGGENQREERE